jgi:hypothetical protein
MIRILSKGINSVWLNMPKELVNNLFNLSNSGKTVVRGGK